MSEKYNEIEIYKAYLEVKGTQGDFVTNLCKRLEIPRSVLYAIVKRIENGNEVQLKRCTEQSKYECLWKYRYQQRFCIIEDLHSEEYSIQIKSLIKEMHEDGFGVREIGRRICKDPSTVNFHLAKKD